VLALDIDDFDVCYFLLTLQMSTLFWIHTTLGIIAIISPAFISPALSPALISITIFKLKIQVFSFLNAGNFLPPANYLRALLQEKKVDPIVLAFWRDF